MKHHSVIYSKRKSARENHPSDVDLSINSCERKMGEKGLHQVVNEKEIKKHEEKLCGWWWG